MKYEELIILLPCHSFDDFPIHHEGEDAEGLLACWTAMWHPALLASAQSLPTWKRCDDPPEQLAGRLLMIPKISQSELPTGLAARAKAEGAVVIRGKTKREEIVQAALAELDSPETPADAEIVADFLALGYCYLQVQLLTRQMHYSSNLDEVHFRNQVIAAADATVRGEANAAELLHACFDTLAEERDHYYPVDAYLIDITLVASTTIGPSLRHELSQGGLTNLMIPAEVLSEMAAREPLSMLAVRDRLEQGTMTLVGGEVEEQRLPMLSPETILAALQRGQREYVRLLGKSPVVFGRRRFGLTPLLPQILGQLGYVGAVHSTLDEGRCPEGTQTKTRWEGLDHSALDALARAPHDAANPQTFLSLCSKLGESMGRDHVATLVFAHYPAQATIWHGDLRRIARFGNVLGKFITLEQYFEATDNAGHLDRFGSDEYRSPYLKQAIVRKQADPIGGVQRYWRHHLAAQSCETLGALAGMLQGTAGNPAAISLAAGVNQLADEAPLETSAAIEGRLHDLLASNASALTQRLPTAGGESGVMLLNPLSFTRRMMVQVAGLAKPPAWEAPVFASGQAGGETHLVVDVPPLGFAWVGGTKGAAKRGRETPLVESNLLRNEFFELHVNPSTGALQSTYDYKQRGNRLSQQIAMRLPSPPKKTGENWTDGDENLVYSVMAADQVKITRNSTACGELTIIGKLMDREGKKLAGYKQQIRCWRGSRVIEFEIELDPQETPRADPWNSYYCARFAWSDFAADLHRGVGFDWQKTNTKKIESPLFVDVEGAQQRTTFLTDGLPFHVFSRDRMLDVMLQARGDTVKKFRLGVCLDGKHPVHEALSFSSPMIAVPRVPAPPEKQRSGWLFHLDAKNVLATHWAALPAAGSEPAGMRVRVQEVMGRETELAMRCFRAVASARIVKFDGQPGKELAVEGDKISFDLRPHQWIEIEARWK